MNQKDQTTRPARPARTNADTSRVTADQEDEARMANDGGTEGQVGDRRGPQAGYDAEPVQVTDRGGVK
jgi:hypothetical protein